MKKLAVIRNNDGNGCPFGLSPIPDVCRTAGSSVDDMAPLDSLSADTKKEDKNKIVTKNIEIFTKNPEKKKCKYAANLFPEKFTAVNCDFGDTAAGQGTAPFVGSPFYGKNLSPNVMDGLYSYPFSSEYDLGISRNQYYGIYQWATRAERSRIRKKALQKIINNI